MKVTQVQAAGTAHVSPFVGPVDHRLNVNVDITALSNTQIDAKGYLKPGVLLNASLGPLGASELVTYATIEATKVAASNSAADIAAASSTELIAVTDRGVINQDIAVDVHGRALTANELAGFAGSKFTLTST